MVQDDDNFGGSGGSRGARAPAQPTTFARLQQQGVARPAPQVYRPIGDRAFDDDGEGPVRRQQRTPASPAQPSASPPLAAPQTNQPHQTPAPQPAMPQVAPPPPMPAPMQQQPMAQDDWMDPNNVNGRLGRSAGNPFLTDAQQPAFQPPSMPQPAPQPFAQPSMPQPVPQPVAQPSMPQPAPQAAAPQPASQQQAPDIKQLLQMFQGQPQMPQQPQSNPLAEKLLQQLNGFQGYQNPMAGQLQQGAQQLMAKPSAYDSDMVQNTFNRLRQGIDQDFTRNARSLDEMMAKRGLYDSTMTGQKYSDLATEKGRSLSNLAGQLIDTQAQQYSADRVNALNAGLGVGQQGLSEFQSNNAIRQGMMNQATGYDNDLFQRSLASAQFNGAQQNNMQQLWMQLLGLS